MKLVKIICTSTTLLLFTAAYALDGEFDRSTEVDKYLPIVKDGARGVLVSTAKDIYVSGISDARLAEAVKERLMRDLPTFKAADRADTGYGIWMAKALASFGRDEDKAALEQVRKQTKSVKLAGECAEELQQFDWHKKKNAVMASRKNFEQGGNQRVAQLMNLLQSDDFSLKYLAADRMSWEKVLDPKLMDEIASQIPRYMNETGLSGGRIETKTIGLYEKLLGYSSNPKYRGVLEQVLQSKAGVLVKKHAREALQRLQ